MNSRETVMFFRLNECNFNLSIPVHIILCECVYVCSRQKFSLKYNVWHCVSLNGGKRRSAVKSELNTRNFSAVFFFSLLKTQLKTFKTVKNIFSCANSCTYYRKLHTETHTHMGKKYILGWGKSNISYTRMESVLLIVCSHAGHIRFFTFCPHSSHEIRAKSSRP